ncbi:TPA: hypothetical protein REB85_002966 [Listeria monocytogenes]|uniref:hypothetical protein n=1 Tax=Bacilli TaxID=91061 RepID=UPI0010E90AC0|nr:hypothetical protein [Listeria innocua]EAE6963912.1 hypothetical protein [Listeria monocytogenes]EAG1593792.1 hypothetical protein [Listeria monocytogenes]EAH4450438.1 hypothetical protein [Listeria innocua]EAV9844976.1 hypothetical protein [Listeria monocytogenes]MCP7998325.1 hypothetical protein [Listeria monocytogenes]
MSKKIENKKSQIQKLEERIREDTERLKRYKDELKQLEANEVISLLESNQLSLEDINKLVKSHVKQSDEVENHEGIS